MLDLDLIWPFLATFGMLLACGIGAPWPEELPVVGAGIWVASHPEHPWRWLMLPVCMAGVIIGDGMLYGIGRWYGPLLFEKPFINRLFPPHKRKKVQDNFHRYGINILLFARVLPGIRGPIFITAGVMRLPLRRFIIADGIYAIPGVCLLFFLSWWFGDQFRDLVIAFENRVGHARPFIILCFLLLVAGYLLYNFLKHPVSTGDPTELPLIGNQLARQIEESSDENLLAERSLEATSQAVSEPAAPLAERGNEPPSEPANR